MTTIKIQKLAEQKNNAELLALECEQKTEQSFYDRSVWYRTETTTKTRMGLIVEQWDKSGHHSVTFYFH